MKPRLLDLFCGVGGAARGYQWAGFHVTGVDINPQPDYAGDEFIQADAIEFAADLCDGYPWEFDAIHASPPCQAFTTMSNRWRGAGGKADSHVNLIAQTRELLEMSRRPYVIENVPGAKAEMRSPFTLSGGMFGLAVDRPRLFESNVFIFTYRAPKPVDPIGVYGKAHDGRRLFTRADGTEQRAASSLQEARAAMGMDWGDWDGVREAIPPAYTEWIGRQLMLATGVKAA